MNFKSRAHQQRKGLKVSISTLALLALVTPALSIKNNAEIFSYNGAEANEQACIGGIKVKAAGSQVLCIKNAPQCSLSSSQNDVCECCSNLKGALLQPLCVPYSYCSSELLKLDEECLFDW